MNASVFPSGEYNGRDSFAPLDTSRCATPPLAGTVQISPPLTNATSPPSVDIAGSANDGIVVGASAIADPAHVNTVNTISRIFTMNPPRSPHSNHRRGPRPNNAKVRECPAATARPVNF